MADSGEQNRFLKSLFYGLPLNPLTREEQTLREVSTVSRELAGIRDRLQLPSTSSLSPAPQYKTSPVINVTAPDQSLALRPHFDELARRQSETAAGIAELARKEDEGIAVQERGVAVQEESLRVQKIQALHALEQAFLSSKGVSQRDRMIGQNRTIIQKLASLDERGRIAYLQRLGIMAGVYSMDEHLVQGFDEVVQGLAVLEHHETVQIGLAQTRVQLLSEIAELNSLSLFTLGRVDDGVQELVEATREQTAFIAEDARVRHEQFAQFMVMFSHALGSLDRIESGIGDIARSQIEINRAVTRIAVATENPVQTQALEKWRIGERCRRAGKSVQALRMFEESNRENPSEPWNYYSLGMLSLSAFAPNAASDFFNEGVAYSEDNPQLTAYFLLHMARVAYAGSNFAMARDLLVRAHEADKKNIDIWFELALCEVQIGNTEQAIYYLNNLLLVAQRLAPEKPEYLSYVQRILNEPLFVSIISQLSL